MNIINYMDKHLEIEYKILVNESQFYELLKDYPNLKFIKQTNYYYDNINNDLRNNKIAMRIRDKGELIYTLKNPCEHGVEEYECIVNSNDPKIFDEEPIKSVLNKFNINGPFICLGALVTYRAMYICDDYELCFDINEYNNYKDYEIEYEYKREHDGLTNFNQILSKVNLTYKRNCASKIKRCLHL